MFDDVMRRFKEYTFLPFARRLVRVPPASLSFLSLLLGILTAVFAWQQWYWLAIVGWSLNRIFDGLDGVVARLSGKQSDFGGYLDIVLDFVSYALIPVGIAAGQPSNVNWLLTTFLLTAFYINSASWIYLSAILEKRNLGANSNGEQTSVTMPDGIVGGFLTIVFYYAFFVLVDWFPYLFSLMGVLVMVGVVQRLIWARKNLS